MEIKKINELLTKLEFYGASTGLLMAVLLNLCQVVNRYWLNFEIMWIGDFTLYVFIFTIYIAISYGASRKTHIAVDILPDYLFAEDRIKRLMFEVVKHVVTIVMVLSIVPSTWKVLKRSVRYPEYATLVRWFNMSWFVYAMSAMLVLVIAHYAWHVLSDFHELKKALWIANNEGGKTLDV